MVDSFNDFDKIYVPYTLKKNYNLKYSIHGRLNGHINKLMKHPLDFGQALTVTPQTGLLFAKGFSEIHAVFAKRNIKCDQTFCILYYRPNSSFLYYKL